jgi:uncharacterized membrane protein YgcG
MSADADDGAMKLTTRKRRRAFVESYEFPMALKNKIRDELDSDRPVNVALEGLREWYLACLEAGPKATLGMPSRAVDVAWHEMILMTRTYHHFCERAFGYYLHHSPEAVMDEPMRDGLARTLVAVERNRALTMAGIPLLFAIDSELDLVGGQSWAEADIAALRDHHRYLDHAGAHTWSGGGFASTCSTGDGGGGGCGGGGCGGGG